MKYLFIAEKNSVMRAVEETYRKHKSEIDRKLHGELIFTALSGHVCRWLEPSEYKEWKDLKWKDLELPLTPEPFLITGSKEKHASEVLNTVKQLVKDEKPDAYIVGTDSDIEGNGIYYLLSHELKITDKPTLRFFEQSLTENEVVDSLMNMTDFYKEPRDVRMTDTFITRSQFDWLVGMNATIAITLRSGELYKVGRVKAPTLKLVYDNSEAIENFIPHSDYQVKVIYADGFSGLMLEEGNGEEALFETEEQAKAFIEELGDAKSASVTKVERNDVKEYAPSLYKLSALQGEAGSKYNYSPKETLDTVQELYEKKFLTYPRTDGTYVSSAKAETFGTLLNTLKKVDGVSEFAENVTASDIERVKKNKKVVNDEEVKKSSHDALLPTEYIPDLNSLSVMQQKIYLLVAKRFLAQFMPPKVDRKTVLLAEINGRTFKSNGSTNIARGWSELYDKKEAQEQISDEINKGNTLDVNELTTHEKKSKPPKRLTSASLVTAMENIAKYIDDKHLKDVMKEAKGIGTQATRADIIEQLISTGYIKCEGKNNALTITDMGKRYMSVLKLFSITDPSSAAEWESLFQSVKEGVTTKDDAMEEILDYVYEFMDEVANADIKAMPRAVTTLDIKCPYCGGAIKKLKWGYACENTIGDKCKFKVSSFHDKVKEDDIKELIVNGVTRKIRAISKSKKSGKSFDARLKLCAVDDDEAVKFSFDEPKELSVKCPYCNGRIFEYSWGFSCENRRDGKCNFSVNSFKGKVQNTDIEELILKGKTRLIKGIGKSKKTGQLLDRYIILNKKGSEYATGFSSGTVPHEQNIVVPDDLKCPYCNGKIIAGNYGFECEHGKDEKNKCSFFVNYHEGKFTIEHLEQLIKNGETSYIEGLTAKSGKPYTAAFKLNKKGSEKTTAMVFPPK